MRCRGTWTVAVALVVVATLAAACADDDKTQGADGGAADASTTTAAFVLPAGYAGHHSEIYADPAHWLCRGDVADDPCDSDLDATVVAADGTLTPDPFRADPDAPIDCFYVYPTISLDPGTTSDLVPDEHQEIYAVRQQAARLGAHCRVFAPVYRQRTLTALASGLGSAPTAADQAARETAYGDVLDAWKQYMANDNHGRGVVLIGHSQGAGILNRLIASEIDGSDALRSRLVSALLLGAAVSVPAGKDVGGDFQHVPACREESQTGCVVSYSSFRADEPPPENSLFGRTRDGEGDALCTNPAALAGGRGELVPYMPSQGGGVLTSRDLPAQQWVTGATTPIDTAFVVLPGMIEAECVNEGGFSYLALHIQGDPADPRVDDIGGDLTPDWGMHLVDVNVAMGNFVDLVGAQADAFTGSH